MGNRYTATLDKLMERMARNGKVEARAAVDVEEQMLAAELQANAFLRVALPNGAARPVVPTGMVERFMELQSLTQETGPAWAARVARVMRMARTSCSLDTDERRSELDRALKLIEPIALDMG